MSRAWHVLEESNTYTESFYAVAESAIATTPIEEVDEDTLRSVLDERGFPRRAKPETSREERL